MKSNEQMFVLWLAFIVFILVLTGCTGTNENPPKEASTDKVSSGQTLTMAYTWNPGGLDPHGRDSLFVMRSGVGETLIKLNKQLEPKPWLAKEWKQVDETTWLFKLQEHVTFHNGKGMDAERVKHSLLRTLDKNQKAKDLLQIESIEVTKL